MDMEVFLQKERMFQAPIKLAQSVLAPELRTRNFTNTRIFLKSSQTVWLEKEVSLKTHTPLIKGVEVHPLT